MSLKKMKKETEKFNMIIAGTGGQGLITLLQIIAEAALLEGKEVRTSELHGLSQRGGSVDVHIRFGRSIHSPLISEREASLILSLEAQEALRNLSFSNEKTVFLANKKTIPIPSEKVISLEKIEKELRKISEEVFVVSASEICEKELKNEVVAGIYLLGFGVSKGLIPLKSESVLEAIKKTVPKKYLELNKKAFNLA